MFEFHFSLPLVLQRFSTITSVGFKTSWKNLCIISLNLSQLDVSVTKQKECLSGCCTAVNDSPLILMYMNCAVSAGEWRRADQEGRLCVQQRQPGGDRGQGCHGDTATDRQAAGGPGLTTVSAHFSREF